MIRQPSMLGAVAKPDVDHVRIGADFNSAYFRSEVARIDFDTEDGEMCVVVERLGSTGVTVVDIFAANDPYDRYRIGNFNP